MRIETRIFGIILIFALVALVGGILFLSKGSKTPPGNDNKTYQIDYSKGQKVGSDLAKVKLVEFSDYECPACAAFNPYVKELLASQSADLQFIYRHFPLPQHPNAIVAIEAAEAAADQGKFWGMHDKLFEEQNQWASLSDPTDYFVVAAKDLALDSQKVREAIKNKTYQSKAEADLNEGISLGINSTPTFFLNGKKLTLQNYADLKKEVEKVLQSPN